MIRLLTLTDAELHELCTSAFAAEELTSADDVVVVQAVADGTTWTPRATTALASLPCVVVSDARAGASAPHVDAFAEPPVVGLDALVSAVEAHPIAAVALTLLQRGAPERSTAAGLVAESTTYSMLQAGPEFASWQLRRRQAREAPAGASAVSAGTDTGPPVITTRDGARLLVTLDRPHVRNALDRAMRDTLADALSVAAADPSVEAIELRGTGTDFCSGGDLNEFGSFTDPASAHLTRLSLNLARAVDALCGRLVVHVHGSCRGSGVELAAFAQRVVTHPDATFALPEVAMGLIPGAGGTVSVTRRVGRQRATAMALSGCILDARTALEWGLVDEE